VKKKLDEKTYVTKIQRKYASSPSNME